MGDANFRLVREMNGKFDLEDVTLADSSAYFTKWALFKECIDKVGDSEEVITLILAIIEFLFDAILILHLQKSTCNHLTAAIMQKITKFKNNDVSGVFAVECACHILFEPSGMVDLQKGEW